jgi:hypothetical protein
MSAHWGIYPSTRIGWTVVYVVDEHGCLLHDEPVCTVPSDYHGWFVEWLMSQPCEWKGPSLLWHPALGETMDSRKEMRAGE